MSQTRCATTPFIKSEKNLKKSQLKVGVSVVDLAQKQGLQQGNELIA